MASFAAGSSAPQTASQTAMPRHPESISSGRLARSMPPIAGGGVGPGGDMLREPLRTRGFEIGRVWR